MPEIVRHEPTRLDVETDVLVIGAGACGVVAGLVANHEGVDVLIVERDPQPFGSTSMSSGFVPAPDTRYQRKIGVTDDSAELFQDDLLRKSEGLADRKLVGLASRIIGPAVEWLGQHARIDWIVLSDFLYPGHSRHRMHAVPEKTGAALLNRLINAAESAEIPIITSARAEKLHVVANRISAVAVIRPDGREETIGCKTLILACGGFGANRDLVGTHIPEIADALYHGHQGNKGAALSWGLGLEAITGDLSGYQGHGSLAHPQNILISWALMTEGGIQINTNGDRFSNEHGGYSEQAVNVLAQPGKVAWNVYDERIHEFALQFPDYRDALQAGAIKKAEDIPSLARLARLDPARLNATLHRVGEFQSGTMTDAFGRDFTTKPPLRAPYYAVKVTGALFHTQGGLMIDEGAHVLGKRGVPIPNLFAGGGAACGVSGPKVSGYLSGNGLLTAIGFGFLAGRSAAETVREEQKA